jgi:DNA (cytosine-5)-methyltransferase 1
LTKYPSTMNTQIKPIPSSEREALERLLAAVDKPLHDMPHEQFMKAWNAVFYLYPGLHPDDCEDHGNDISHDQEGPERFQLVEPRLIAPFHVKSGWPVLIAPIATEAHRRYAEGLMTEEELYPSDAQCAGMDGRQGGDESSRCVPLLHG